MNGSSGDFLKELYNRILREEQKNVDARAAAVFREKINVMISQGILSRDDADEACTALGISNGENLKSKVKRKITLPTTSTSSVGGCGFPAPRSSC